MKSIIRLSVCALVLVYLTISNGVFGQASHIVMGNANNLYNDPVIYNRTIEMKPPQSPWYKRWFSTPLNNVTYTFPPNQYQTCVITSVIVKDVEPYGKGGVAQIMDGGLKQNNITINFISRTGSPMRFRITITGYCVPTTVQSVYQNSSSLHANPINNTANGSYGWALPLSGPYYNSSILNNTSGFYNGSGIAQNLNMTSGTPWWHFW